MICQNKPENFLRRVRSFVRRDGRMSDAQKRVIKLLWPQFGLSLQKTTYDLDKAFGRSAPRTLEIGFGSGYSLLEIAKAKPEEDFIGIETYQPGIGTLLQGVEAHGLTNIRLFYADAVDVITQCIADESLDVIQLFFPDPWPKRKHHKRRIIQDDFIKLIATKLQRNGLIHLATDWEDYAVQMMQVLSRADFLKNVAGAGNYAERSAQRPVVTKFEQRGNHCGRAIRELQFAKDISSGHSTLA